MDQQPAYITQSQLFDVFTPLLLALHEKKLLDIAEVPHLYEDVLTRRQIDAKPNEADLVFLQGLIVGLQRLATAVKGSPP
jgi:hypothetical protein